MADYTLPGREFFRRSIIEQRGNPYHDPSNGRFCSGGGSGLTNSGKSVRLDSKGVPFKYPTVNLAKKEYSKVMHEINTLYNRKYKGKSDGWIIFPKTAYHFEIHGFDEYNIYEKIKN